MNRKGFSLIEVLVATALLVMIVGMIGFVFRQSSMSWDSGIKRAEGISQVRTVLGAIERDLRRAVDAREFGSTSIKNDFANDKKLSFIVLSEPDPGNPDARVPTQIVYSGGTKVERTANPLECKDGTWTVKSGKTIPLLESTSSVSDINVTFKSFYPGSDKAGLPAYVTIVAEVDTSEDFSSLKVSSDGPDGKPGTSDDIVVQ